MAETTEAVPANAPWLQKWDTVAKASGEYTAPAKAQEGPVAAVKRVVKPWLMEWGLIAKESPVAPSKPSVPLTPSRVDVSTEAKMKKAVYIAPNEMQPDTRSASSNIAEIDSELKRNPPEATRKILMEERRKYDTSTIEPGNIDLTNRPQVKNSDGSISTVRSIGINIDGQEVLIPTVVGNKVVSDKEAIAEYKRTGKHLGKFSSVAASNAYAERLHKDQEKLYKGK